MKTKTSNHGEHSVHGECKSLFGYCFFAVFAVFAVPAVVKKGLPA
jgi:hypothetical protein